ncbi:cytochrome b [Thiohalobacter sp. COW1]|uniref:cytochrome b n=1 Tax=Thiohalobacter sp. COW1 TaxID=2795687 RepID=UPI0019160DDB|nr:cytochrome b [Thiohalobacter sp. COW1]BCO30678.1 cytochrome b [Thiohalobacter sp. COW1]
MLRNTSTGYGWISILLHWLVALVIIGLFALGLWMTDLTYYDPWYREAPAIHKSVGILLFLAILLRLAWRWCNPRPVPLSNHKPWERRLAHWTHVLLYALPLLVMVSGYLISTAEGRPVEVFDWFSVPATFSGYEQQEDIAGEIHEILAFILIGLASVHALAALKHHFIDRDRTLRRMLRSRNDMS